MKKGTILLWYGSIATIPYGWHLCNGEHETPNLNGLFVAGASDTYGPNDTGGSDTHDHPFTSNTHAHDLPIPSPNVGSSGLCYRRTNPKYPTGTTGEGGIIPEYKILCYIQKLVQSKHNE